MDKDSDIDFNKVFPVDDEGDAQPDTMDSRLIAKSEPVKSAIDLLPYHLKRGGYMPYVRDYVDPLF